MSKVKQWHKRCLCAVLMGALLAGVSGCGEKQQSAGMDENLLLAEREKADDYADLSSASKSFCGSSQ